VLDQGEVGGIERIKPTGSSGLRHRVIQLPVLVAYGRRRRSRIVEKDIARRFLRLAFQILALVKSIECGLDDAWILASLNLLLQRVARGAAGDIHQGR